jgi:hypothetical protein
MKQAFVSRRAAHECGLADAREDPTTAKCHRCERRTEIVYDEGENSMRSVYPSCGLRLKCVIRKLGAANSLLGRIHEHPQTAEKRAAVSATIAVFKAGYQR